MSDLISMLFHSSLQQQLPYQLPRQGNTPGEYRPLFHYPIIMVNCRRCEDKERYTMYTLNQLAMYPIILINRRS